jgi:hypothetical protein
VWISASALKGSRRALVPVARDLAAVGQVHGRRGHVEADRRDAQVQHDVGLGEVLGRGEGRVPYVPLADQHLLRERRAIVGGVGLVTDQRNGAVVALTAQCLGQAPSGESGADHHHVV